MTDAQPHVVTSNISNDFAVRRVKRVVDADTFDLEVDLGFHQSGVYRFRLADIDAAELYGKNATPEGREAKEFAEAWLAERSERLRLRSYKTGSFGRWLATIYDASSGESLGQALVDADLAEPYRRP